MSKNLKKKALSFGSMFGLALSGVVAMPASALTGEVEINPTTGSNWGVFYDDTFNIEAGIRAGNGLYTVTDTEVEGVGGYVDVSTLTPSTSLEVTGIKGEDIEIEIYLSYADQLGLERTYAREFSGVVSDDLGWYAEVQPITAYAYDAKGVLLDDFEMDVYEDGTSIEGYYSLGSDDFEGDQEDVARIVVSAIPEFDRVLNYGIYLDEYDTGTPDEVEFGDGDKTVATRVWIENGVNPKTVETAYASASETVTWYDPAGVVVTPRIERFVAWEEDLMLSMDNFNVFGDTLSPLGFTLQFSKPVNKNQIDVTDWSLELLQADLPNPTIEEPSTDEVVLLYGTSARDDVSKLYFAADSLATASKSYRVTAQYANSEKARVYTSTAYKAPSTSVDDVYDISWSSSDTKNVLLSEDDAYDTEPEVRSGTKSVTWTAQLREDADDTALKQAGVPVLAVVSTDFDGIALEDATITVAGQTLTEASEAVVISGNTNASGQFAITVTHSSATEGEGYTVEFFYLDSDDYYTNSDGQFNVVYEDAYVDEIEASSEVIASSNVALTFTVTDQFGEPISKFDDEALSVRLLSTNVDDIEQYKAVAADGTVSFSFANYLKAPDTDVLAADVGTGLTESAFDDLSDSFGSTVRDVNREVFLYAPIAVSSIITDTTVATYVNYSDFITGKASATNVPPAADEAAKVAGTVAGADNGGLPGAPVVIKGTGLQFFNGLTYSIGETTVIADVDGNFSVDVWTHSANAKGQEVTITAGSVTQKVTLTSALPQELTGANLSFSWTLPAQVVKNTTYAVTLKLTDKWGNPVNASSTTDMRAVEVEAAGSLEVNGENEVNRNFGTDGTATVFIRSVKDVAGPGSLKATLNDAATYSSVDGEGDSNPGDLNSLGPIATNTVGTVWDESKWSSTLETDVQVLDAPAGKVNVGSFNGKLVVYASGLQGSTISWKVGGVWGKAVATSNYSVFDRPTPRRGVTVTVDIYVNGVKQLTKSVVTR